jgi:hypothetical protein
LIHRGPGTAISRRIAGHYQAMYGIEVDPARIVVSPPVPPALSC